MDLFHLSNYTQPPKKQRMYSPTDVVSDGLVGPTLTISPYAWNGLTSDFMPTSASSIKQQQDNHMTTLLLANNLLSSLTALTTHLEFTDPQLLMSNHIQTAHKLISSFITLLRTPKQKPPTPDLPPTTTFIPHSTMMSPSANTKITTINDSQQWVANQTVIKKQLNVSPTPISQQIASPSSEFERTLLRDFNWIKVIGVGSFGTVWLVKHNTTGTPLSLKVVSKAKVVKFNQIQHIFNEKTIMLRLKNPFIVKLHRTFQDRENLYLLMEYVPGGEFFNYIRQNFQLSNPVARFYAAEIILAIEYLHHQKILYRDLKPENILLDERGHIKLVDFGFAKYTNDRTYSMCGTTEYMSPEIVAGSGHDRTTDWWSLGILIYEMLVGCPPWSGHDSHIFERILRGDIEWPDTIDPLAKDLIEKLLVKDRFTRLGNAQAIKKHPWFSGVDWNEIAERKHPGPIIPDMTKEAQSNFETSREDAVEKDPRINYEELFSSF